MAPAGSVFFYNTPAYAVTKRVLAAAAKHAAGTHHPRLADRAGRHDQHRLARSARPPSPTWATRPAWSPARATSPASARSCWTVARPPTASGSSRKLASKAMFVRTETNPAYGRLWWLNGST
jgi:hypothetical protein